MNGEWLKMAKAANESVRELESHMIHVSNNVLQFDLRTVERRVIHEGFGP